MCYVILGLPCFHLSPQESTAWQSWGAIVLADAEYGWLAITYTLPQCHGDFANQLSAKFHHWPLDLGK